MANKKQIEYTKAKGYELVITNNPYGDRIERMLEFYIHIDKKDDGRYIAYYSQKEFITDDLERLANANINIEFIKPFKEVLLVDVLPPVLPKFNLTIEKYVEMMCSSVETEYDMSGKHSAESKAKRKERGKQYGSNEMNEWGEPTTYDCAKVYSINQYKVNGCFS